MTRFVVFASGKGTNFLHLLDRIESKELNHECVGLVCDKDCRALALAQERGLPTYLAQFKNRDKASAEADILACIRLWKADYIVLSGYMRIVGPTLLTAYAGKIINLHPAYLPEFPGAHSIEDAYLAGVKQTGVTVHFVDEGIDTGPIIKQVRVPIYASDDLASLEARVHETEYALFWQVIKEVLDEASIG